MHVLTVPNQKATANYVPVGGKRYPELSARKRLGVETGKLEEGKWNSMCSGEMRRDMEEHQWRRRLSGL